MIKNVNFFLFCFSRECKFGTQVDDMQLASLWQDDNLITVSLSGHINYLDPATAQIKKVVKVRKCLFSAPDNL